MKSNDRHTNQSTEKVDANKAAVLPTKNAPGDDRSAGSKHGGDTKPGKTDDTGKDKRMAEGRTNRDGSDMKSPGSKPRDTDQAR